MLRAVAASAPLRRRQRSGSLEDNRAAARLNIVSVLCDKAVSLLGGVDFRSALTNFPLRQGGGGAHPRLGTWNLP
jgi:hypothetical protein